MRKIIVVLVLIFAGFWGCSSEYETSLTLKNLAAGAVYLNFKGELTKVPAGQTVILKKLPRGTYEYSTTYAVPAGVNTSTAVGDYDGEIKINPGTKVLIFYTSTLTEDSYTLYATKTTSEDLGGENNSLFP